ncbi:WXG100 family type VII secretion target [Bacillus thuringiensis]|uniref:WXG100 family type VII secretion target n=1 Tax=Bacillus thuringiensis TaxID=1428 RepID=A0A9X6U2H6_BACTU|nr:MULTISPECIES: WXG100 family type VII secretion target [Bacillus]HDX9510039.1 WXG100 family type VII secretion target [Bacillus cereus]EPF11482.1 WXG100 family type VII secretion target [Bacillus cereus BAG1O-3]MDR4413805.1 WXG100 family type VII secretion target [Bacillus thuringiensis]MED2914775.1 WXG100 family type VII secretion target [Bacillus thuringiensis]MED2921650.1 WXG100 family type VII secretion target [Bacillus thuringiensis]
MEIKVKPEQLEQIAKNISEMQTHSQTIQQNLNQSMFSIQMQWQGATSQHFYGEYMRSMRLMESYIRNLQVTEKELRRIAQKFRQADEEYQKKQNEKLKETHKTEKKHEKSWWEKGVEGAAEFIGVNDAIRAVTGKDPITGKELSSKERLIAAGWTLLNFVPVGKVASLAGKGIKYVASSFGKTIVKAGKRLGEGVTMVAGKAGKAAVDGIKTASHKVTEGVNFVASTAKGFADKIGSLWNKGATTVKTTFLQGNEKIQHAVKTLLEYKWIPGLGKAYVMPGVGMVREMGQHSLKDAYQYMESKVVKGTVGANNFKFGDNAKNHLKNVENISTKKGVSGGHNMDEFYNALKNQGVDVEDLIISKKSHSSIEGIYEIEYKIPRKDMAGNIAEPVSYKNIKEPKTIYDPAMISDDKIYQWGKEAMQKGTINGRLVEGTASNGLKFRGYLNDTGEITNFFPILD